MLWLELPKFGTKKKEEMNSLRTPLARICRNYIATRRSFTALPSTQVFRLYSTEQPQQPQQQQPTPSQTSTSTNTESSNQQENSKETPIELNLGKRV